jgi:hypothetical protein
MKTNYSTIQRGGVVANSILIAPIKRRVFHFVQKRCGVGLVANNGRCTLVSPIDKNTSRQPQTFNNLNINKEVK